MENLQIDCDINPPSDYGLSAGHASMCRFTLLVNDEPFKLDEWLNTDGTLERVDSHIKCCQPETFAQVVNALDCTDAELWDALNEAARDEVAV